MVDPCTDPYCPSILDSTLLGEGQAFAVQMNRGHFHLALSRFSWPASITVLCWLIPSIIRADVSIPPHRSIHVPGVHSYTDPMSVTAGEVIEFHVSSTVPYQLSIYRLGTEVDNPSGDELVHVFPEARPVWQEIYPGSYIRVGGGLKVQESLTALTLECWVKPFRTDAWAGLISEYDFQNVGSFSLMLSPGGRVAFYLGDGGPWQNQWLHESPDRIVQAGQWHHVVATWDGHDKTLWVDAQKVGQWLFSETVHASGIALRLAAYGWNGKTNRFLDGDMALPVIYNTAFSEDEIRARFADRGLTLPAGTNVIACWPFSEERGDTVADLSSYNHQGQIINRATWMIGGPSFDADVARFGAYEPQEDTNRGHGLRFASDDLYDCRWEVSHSYRIPETSKPGVYVGRFQYEWKGVQHLYHTTFIVKKAETAQKSPILVLCSTNTWKAYNHIPFPQPIQKLMFESQELVNSPTRPPAYSLYRKHAAGQGTYQVGLRIPWPAAAPYLTHGLTPTYSHLLRAERFFHVWLEESGYNYDVITDLDLHQNSDILDGYSCVVINGHSEYWSAPAYQTIERYLSNDGNVICFSGNTMFWRVSFNDDGTVMECRKVDAPGYQISPDRRGETWHSQDRRRGGLMRESGFPAWKLIGLETFGWINIHPEQFGPYHIEQANHFLFTLPEPVGIKRGDILGQASEGGLPAANGHEFDAQLSTILGIQNEPPPIGAPVLRLPEGIVRLAKGTIYRQDLGSKTFDYFMREVAFQDQDERGGEMIYWKRPEGGQVFNAGSIGTGWALSADPKLQQLLRNVLLHFGVEPNKEFDSVPEEMELPADFNGDGIVGFTDFFIFADNFGKQREEPGFDTRFDLNGDSRINFSDFFIFAYSFGKAMASSNGRP